MSKEAAEHHRKASEHQPMPLGITRKRPSSTKMAGKNKLLRAGFLEK